MARLFLLAASAAVIGTAVNFLPSRSWIQEVNNNFWFYYFLTHLFSLIFLVFYWKRSRWPRTLLVLAFLSVIGACLYLPVWIPFLYSPSGTDAQSQEARAQTEISVLYANVYSGNNQKDRFIKLIRERSPDIVAAVEVNPEWEEALGVLNDQYPFRRVLAEPGNFGLALYSRFPFSGDAITSVGSDLPLVIIQDIMLSESGRVTLYVLHTLPPIASEYHQLNYLMLRRVATMIKHSDAPMILVGDLNATPFSRHLAILKQAGLQNAMYGRGLYRTWNAMNPILRFTIDYVLHKGGLRVRDASVLGAIGSDHLPLLISLSVPIP